VAASLKGGTLVMLSLPTEAAVQAAALALVTTSTFRCSLRRPVALAATRKDSDWFRPLAMRVARGRVALP